MYFATKSGNLKSSQQQNPPTHTHWINVGDLHSRELKFPTKALLKMIFPFPRWDMLVPWRVFIVCYFFWGGGRLSKILIQEMHYRPLVRGCFGTCGGTTLEIFHELIIISKWWPGQFAFLIVLSNMGIFRQILRRYKVGLGSRYK